jgi:hypothetical protein
VTEDEAETRELFQTEPAQAYVGQQRRLQHMREGHAASARRAGE